RSWDLDERRRGEGALAGTPMPEHPLAPRARSIQPAAELEEQLGDIGGGRETIANAGDPAGGLQPDPHRRIGSGAHIVLEPGPERDELRRLTDDTSLEAFSGSGQHLPLGELAGQRGTDRRAADRAAAGRRSGWRARAGGARTAGTRYECRPRRA